MAVRYVTAGSVFPPGLTTSRRLICMPRIAALSLARLATNRHRTIKKASVWRLFLWRARRDSNSQPSDP